MEASVARAHPLSHQVNERAARKRSAAENHRARRVESTQFAFEVLQAVVAREDSQRAFDVLEFAHDIDLRSMKRTAAGAGRISLVAKDDLVPVYGLGIGALRNIAFASRVVSDTALRQSATSVHRCRAAREVDVSICKA